MNITLILQLIIAAFKFPEEMSKFLKLIQKSPEQKRQEIVKQVDAWMKDSSESEEPIWEE